MTIEKDQILKYLADLRAYFANYHNHKETSAWAAIAFSVLLAGPGITTLAMVTDNSTPLRVTATVVVVAVLIVTVAYLREQFHLRAYAANVVGASDFWATSVLTADEKDLKASDFVLTVVNDARIQGPYTLPQCIQTKAESLGSKGQEARVALEGCAYFLIVALFVLVIARLWA